MDNFASYAKYLRYWCLRSTTRAGSGHLSSSLSAADLMAVLVCKYFLFDPAKMDNLENDRLIFSKGHAAPLLYACLSSIGVVDQNELLELRQYQSELEGHPTPRLKFIDFATGSLGIGFGNASGMALGMKKRGSKGVVWVLLGDGELAEGSIWETAAFASKHELSNFVAIVDVNRLGQTGETAYGYDLEVYRKRFEAFGWEAHIIDGHSYEKIEQAISKIRSQKIGSKPTVIIAKTIKGKGVSLIEDQDGWHGKVLSEPELKTAVFDLGKVDSNYKVELHKPKTGIFTSSAEISVSKNCSLSYAEPTSVRQAVGEAVADIAKRHSEVIVFDGDVANSTYTSLVKDELPDQFVECFISEQQMVSAAIGMEKAGYRPIIATFAAFLTRAYDQIRMAAVSRANIILIGTHVGVSIGQDGPSQMGLEDMAMIRAVCGSKIISPADAVSAYLLTQSIMEKNGVRYIRSTRGDLPVLYQPDEKFEIGKGKVLRKSDDDKVTIIATGICVHEALKAYEKLKLRNITARVIDMYSIKPIDGELISKAAFETGHIVTVEDHWYEGGLGDAVLESLIGYKKVMPHVERLAIKEMPSSGKPSELMKHYKIDANAIVEKVSEVLEPI